MAAARYWRLQGIETYGYKADLELSELALYEGATRVDGSATLTSTVAPVSGLLADLKDGDLATTARFLGADVFSPGFSINWDFGAGVIKDISKLQIGSGPSDWRWMYQFSLRSSNDGETWLPEYFAQGLAFPGAHTLTASLQGGDTAPSYSYVSYDEYYDKVVLHMPMSGGNNSTTFTDLKGKTVAVYGQSKISTEQSRFGGSSAYFDGSGDYLRIASSPDFDFGTGDFTIELWVYVPLWVAHAGTSIRLLERGAYGSSAGAWQIYASKTNSFCAMAYGASGQYVAAGFVLEGRWNHVAISRYSGIARGFVNGIASDPYPMTASLSTVSPLFIAAASDGGECLNGYIDDVRITKGKARYTDNFTPTIAGTAGVDNGLQLQATKRIGLAQSVPGIINPQDIGDTHQNAYSPLVLSKDTQYGGRGKVVGTVKQKSLPANTPLGRRVRLINERDGVVVREGWSNPDTGWYEFLDIDPSLTYTVLGYDHLHNFRAVVADNLTPELMP